MALLRVKTKIFTELKKPKLGLWDNNDIQSWEYGWQGVRVGERGGPRALPCKLRTRVLEWDGDVTPHVSENWN